MSVTKYNSVFSVAVSVDHNYRNPDNVPVELLISAMEEHIAYLKKNPDEANEEFYHENTIPQKIAKVFLKSTDSKVVSTITDR